MASKTKLIFKLGEESFPTVLSGENKTDSPFAKVIVQAETRLESIAAQLLAINNKCDNGISNPDIWKDSTPNNLIAFLGDRGSGKTSCMRTLALECMEKHRNWLFAEEIDPSFFDKDHNVLEILIGTLYGEFKKATKNWQKKTLKEQNDLRGIQESFKELKATLRYLKKDKTSDAEEEYEIDSLNHLNSGGRIRIMMKGLIDRLLNLYEKKMLIVSIDDLDLNIEQSYEMMEHIRKYLIIPNLIIITAAKFGQLFDSICLDLTKVYKEISQRVTGKDIAEMTERYLNKLLPLDQRFDMPQTESYMDASMVVVDEDGNKVYESETILLGVPSLIFEKTRYLFYNSSGMPSLVIPRNLRALRMLMSMMVKMKPYADTTQAQNKQIFKDYFFNEWLGIIEPKHRSFAKSLLEEENLAKINHLVIKKLYEFFLSKTETFAQLQKSLEKAAQKGTDNSFVRQRRLLCSILNPSNSFWNISIGDVVAVFNAVKRTNDSADALFLLFFIESFYSIKLYETYDRLTEMTDEDGLHLPADTTTTAPELKTSVRGDMPEYFRLVGGSFFSSAGDSFISVARKRQQNEFRDFGLINGKILLGEIRVLEKKYSNFFPKNRANKKVKIPKSLSARLRLCEFFMLTVRNRIDVKRSDSNIRLLAEPVYFKDFGAMTKNLMFDITMPFLNAVYPERAYGRFGKDIFEYAKKDPDSLLNRMTNLKSRGKDNVTWELMSKSAIRNMEILEDLTEWLQDRKASGRVVGSSFIDALIAFYSQFEFKESKDPIPVGKYCVKTYGKTSEKGIIRDNDPFYYIDYSVFAEVGKVLEEIKYTGGDKEMQAIAKDGSDFFITIFNQNALFSQKDKYTAGEIFEALEPSCGKFPLDLYFGEGSEKILTDEEVGRELAVLRMEHRYDFKGKLPIGVDFYYNNYVNIIYKQRQGDVSNKKASLEAEIKELQKEQDTLNETIKLDTKDLAQYTADVRKLKLNAVKQQAKTQELESNLSYFRGRLESETDKTELKRLRKEEENLTKSLNAINAEAQADMAQLALLKTHSDDATKSINKNIEEEKNCRQSIKEKEKDLHGIQNDMNELEFIMRNPVAID